MKFFSVCRMRNKAAENGALTRDLPCGREIHGAGRGKKRYKFFFGGGAFAVRRYHFFPQVRIKMGENVRSETDCSHLASRGCRRCASGRHIHGAVLFDYAQGLLLSGARMAVSRYCSHRYHFPSVARRSLIGRGSSAPPETMKSFARFCSSKECGSARTVTV